LARITVDTPSAGSRVLQGCMAGIICLTKASTLVVVVATARGGLAGPGQGSWCCCCHLDEGCCHLEGRGGAGEGGIVNLVGLLGEEG